MRGEEKERLTLEAMQRGEPLIYSGRIQEAGLLGDPDLLRKETGGYIAGDIKSGSGEEGPEDDVKPKLHYAVQLGLYTEFWSARASRRDAAPSSGTFMERKSLTISWRSTANATRQHYGRITNTASIRRRPSSAGIYMTRPAYSAPANSATGIPCAWNG